ncbi:hypothetical protein [Shiella aurantiaca]|uniref:hypothetical protein n=1 Tax=Shiella aurantiaca TaxID=3058365 RepID=UPI0029F53A31|nr:hypothetical protein [Shiella aurantiaca]
MSGQLPKGNKPDKDVKKIKNKDLKKLYETAFDIVEDLNKTILSLPSTDEQDLFDKHKKSRA